MANFTSTHALQVMVHSYVEGQRAVPSGWRQLYEFNSDDVPSMRLASISGAGEVPQWDGTSDLDVATLSELGSKSLDYVKYGLQVRIPKLDAKDVPGLIEQAARKLGIATDSTYGTIAAAKLNNAFGTTTTADGKALVADDHTTRTSTRDNKSTSAFDRTALFVSLAQAANWHSYEDLDYDLSEMGWYLAYPAQSATLMETVPEVLGSAVSSSEMQLNAAAGWNITPVPWAKIDTAGSANWFLISKVEKPLVFWERQGPQQTLDIDEDNRSFKISVDFAVVCQCRPQPDGIFGSDA